MTRVDERRSGRVRKRVDKRDYYRGLRYGLHRVNRLIEDQTEAWDEHNRKIDEAVDKALAFLDAWHGGERP